MRTSKKYRVTLIGEKDNGKSTLLGKLLLLTGAASKERIDDAKGNMFGGRFEPAFLLDNFSEERQNGLTLDSTKASIFYKDRSLEFTDVPGHEELIKNMLSGASESKAAVFVVSANKGEGFTSQAKRHLDVAVLLEMKSIVVAVNKIDAVGYSQDRFNSIRKDILNYLSRLDFEGKVTFIPVSAYDGDNLVERSKRTPWYHGMAVLDAVVRAAETEKPQRRSNRLRILVQGEVQNEKHTLFLGRVCSGRASQGSRLSVEPGHDDTKIAALFVDGSKAEHANSGKNISLSLGRGVRPKKGSVLYGDRCKPHTLLVVKAKLFIIDNTGMVRPDNASIKINNTTVGVNDISIVKSRVDCNIADAQLTLDKEYPMERFETVPELGRFLLYSGRSLAGIGVVQ
jgi:sulfate adenylyltransferase subunit 1 (EFTu-like GTPase family)